MKEMNMLVKNNCFDNNMLLNNSKTDTTDPDVIIKVEKYPGG
jgi:hypothetical protein